MTENEVSQVLAQHIGTRLQRARRERGLRLVDVARGIVSVGYLSMIEQGLRKPSPDVVRALARRLDVDVAVLEAGSLASPKLHDVVQWQDAYWAYLDGDLSSATAQFTGILERQSTMVPAATRWLARSLFDQNQPEEALRYLRRPVALLCEPHDGWTPVFIDLLSGLCLLKAGDLEAAESLLENAVKVAAREMPETNLHMYALGYLGRCRVRRGFMQGALAAFDECRNRLDLLVPGENLPLIAQQCRASAIEARDGEDLVAAIRWNERASIFMNLQRAANHGAALTFEIAAFHLRREGEAALKTAADLLTQILTVMNRHGHCDTRSRAHFLFAEIALRRGDGNAALAAVNAGMSETPDYDQPWALALQARAHFAVGSSARAYECADRACEVLAASTGSLRRTDELVEPWEYLADFYRNAGQLERAWQCMRNAVAGAGLPPSLVSLATV